MGLGIYFVVVQVAASRGVPAASGGEVLPLVLSLVAASVLLGGLAFRWWVFSGSRARTCMAAEPDSADLPPPELEPLEQKLAVLARRTFAPYLIALGMLESCVLMGLVLALIRGDSADFLPFFIAGLIGWVLSFPRLESFVEQAAVEARMFADHAART